MIETTMTWLSVLPPVLTIALAIWSRRIVPSLILGLLVGGYLLNPQMTGGFETAVDKIVATLTDKDSLQVLLFLYVFSGLIGLIKKSGGIQAFSSLAQRVVTTKRGVLLLLWALVPVTFIDCGFRIVGAGSIARPLAEKNGVAREQLAFMLNNTASPIVELIPIATTFVGFNVAVVTLGLANAGLAGQVDAYSIWLRAIPFQFFSLVALAMTFLSVFFSSPAPAGGAAHDLQEQAHGEHMGMEAHSPAITPRLINVIAPMLAAVSLSIFFFWRFGYERTGEAAFLTAITNSEPNRAMLVALIVTVFLTSIFYALQKYSLKAMVGDIISGGNEIMPTLVILALAWPLAGVSQDLGLNLFIQQQTGESLPAWGVPITLFALSSAITYFIGSGWGAASLIMPFGIPLAVSTGVDIPLCIAAVITGGTFGDVTSPVAGMTNMSSNVARADHAQYLGYAAPRNFLAAGIAAVLFLVAGLVM